MCELRAAIDAVSREADRLAEVCEAALYGSRPKSPITNVVHVAFRDLAPTPLDMAVQLGKLP